VVAVIHRPLIQIKEDMLLGALRLDDAIIELADEDRVEDIVRVLSVRAGLASDDALRLFIGVSERPAALFCRMAGVGLNGYSAVLRMRRRARKGAQEEPAALLNAYLQLGALPGSELSHGVQTSLAATDG
jgi:hypothetical protein